jgi:tetratricopeptide (TPR) repeat protein
VVLPAFSPEILMHELIPKGTIEELCAHRERALEMYRQAGEMYAAAHRAAQRALDGTSFYGLSRHDLDCLCYNPSAEGLLENARKNLDRQLWRYLMDRSRLSDVMDAKAREELAKSLGKDPPAANADNIAATLSSLIGDAPVILKRGLITLFENLSPEFRRHDAFRFTGKLVIKSALSAITGSDRWQTWDHWSKGREHLLDLERVLFVLDGKEPPSFSTSVAEKVTFAKHGASSVETDYLDLRWFKNGNMHITIKRADLVERINAILAERGGIPDARRAA